MPDIIFNYANAVISGASDAIAETLASSVVVMPPGGNQPNEGVRKATAMLGAVAKVVGDFKCTRVYQGPDGWSTILLEGTLEQLPVQFIDQVHVGEDGLIDHIDIFLRPASLAPVLLAKVTAELQQQAS